MEQQQEQGRMNEEIVNSLDDLNQRLEIALLNIGNISDKLQDHDELIKNLRYDRSIHPSDADLMGNKIVEQELIERLEKLKKETDNQIDNLKKEFGFLSADTAKQADKLVNQV
jgi:phosphoribosylaminoimidazole-succinocarboxamide synthase